MQVTDEFNENALNTDLWKSGYPWGNFVYNLDLLYKNENIEVNNGIMSLVTQKPATPEPIVGENLDAAFLKKQNRFPNDKGEFTYNYSGGAISSIRQFKYGYFEMRFKANSEKGI